MKTAKEMFEDLGYEFSIEKTKYNDNKVFNTIKYHSKGYGMDGGYYSDEVIKFDTRNKHYNPDANYFGNRCGIVTRVDLHKAIHQQMKELGWLDEKV